MNVGKNRDPADIIVGATREYSETEMKVKKMAEINPVILQLIQEFDLIANS